MNPDRSIVLHRAAQLVTVDPRRATAADPLGVIPEGSLVLKAGKIVWLGPSSEIRPADQPEAEWVDAAGQIVLPGLIDSHTHPVFAGDRADEFEQRLQGKTYTEIAAAGGGIQKTVMATRQASEQELYDLTKARLLRMLSFGVTTVEAKSGYGLDLDSELKSLRVIDRLGWDLPMTVCATTLGAHDIPVEYRERPEDYVTLICREHLPQVAREGLAEFCDVFCEAGYFTVDQSRRILETAQTLGLKLKIHAEEFTDLGGATLAGELGAVSADHLLHISDRGIAALKAGGMVATLLPGTAFFLRLGRYAPARGLIEAGVPVALATDFNPGSCMTENLQLIMTLACLEMGLTPAEVIRGVTLNAARALDRQHDRGSLEVGKRADLALFAVGSYPELLYHFGVNLLSRVYIAGRPVLSEVGGHQNH